MCAACNRREWFLPKRIILIRHGESEGNRDTTTFENTPDYKIPLTALGLSQARFAGKAIRNIVEVPSRSEIEKNWKVYFYVSPYERTRQTMREIGKAFPKERIIGAREECRIREQDFGNFQIATKMELIKKTRMRYGRFFFRFPDGESAADVFDRICGTSPHPVIPLFLISANANHAIFAGFMESLWRDIEMKRLNQDSECDINLVIITHGVASRVFLMKWFKWTVDQFDGLNNPDNCEHRVLELGSGGEYSLAINHSPDELREWGLSPEMIVDQQWRATATGGSKGSLDDFFDGEEEETEENNNHQNDQNSN